MSLKAIVFDFDGVIANSEPLHFRGYRDVLAEEGVTLTEPDYYARYLGFDDVGRVRGDRAGTTAPRGATRRSGASSRARPCGSRRSSATCRCSFPAPPTRSAAPPRPCRSRSPRARAATKSGACWRAKSARVLHGDRRRRRHAGQQAGARSVSARFGTARVVVRRSPARGGMRRDRGFAMGSGIGAGRGAAHGGRDKHLRRRRSSRI